MFQKILSLVFETFFNVFFDALFETIFEVFFQISLANQVKNLLIYQIKRLFSITSSTFYRQNLHEFK